MDYNRLAEQASGFGFAKLAGIRITKLDFQHAEGEIELTREHFNPGGTVHGGCLFSLADTVAGAALVTTGNYCTTLNASIDFLRAAGKSRILRAVAKPVRVGKHVAVFEVEMTNGSDELVAKATVTFYILGPVEE